MTAIDGTLAALADPTRRKVVELLMDRPRPAGELAKGCRMSPPAMSRHLRVLREQRIIEAIAKDDDARVRIYQLRRKPFTDLKSWLIDVESFWTDQLAAFKQHAEGKR